MKRRIARIVLLCLLLTLVIAPQSELAVLRAIIYVTNLSTAEQDGVVIPVPMSTAALIDSGIMSTTTLNNSICGVGLNCVTGQTGNEIPYSPGPGRTRVLGALYYATTTATTTDWTTPANETTADDVTLLPSTVSVEDSFYFVADHPFRLAWLNISTAGSRATDPWVLNWEYFGASSTWYSLQNLQDGTQSFGVLGRNAVSWDMPLDFATTTIGAATGYAVRARVLDIGSGSFVEPLATQLWYEIGEWYVFNAAVGIGSNAGYDLWLGGQDAQRLTPTYSAQRHNFMAGVDGWSVANQEGMEPVATGTEMTLAGYFAPENVTASSTAGAIFSHGEDWYLAFTGPPGQGRFTFVMSTDGLGCSITPGDLYSAGVYTVNLWTNRVAGQCQINVTSGFTINSDTDSGFTGSLATTSDPWIFYGSDVTKYAGLFRYRLDAGGGYPYDDTNNVMNFFVDGERNAATHANDPSLLCGLGPPFLDCIVATTTWPIAPALMSASTTPFVSAYASTEGDTGVPVSPIGSLSLSSGAGFATATTIGNIPGNEVVTELAGLAGWPVEAYWIGFSVIILLLVLVGTYIWVQNPLVSVTVTGAVVIAFTLPGVGIYPFWVIFPMAVIWAATFLFGRGAGVSV
ncbi:hypothetical protein CMI37_29685 [Candidatus Pacearchaeota archaeon]|nr:hypothetical protein [Candidatus Pacearchaeota archaeon]